MSIKSRIAIVAALILGAASSDLATRAFAANNYDSPDWAPSYSGSAVGREPRVSLHKENADRFVPGARWQLSHKTDRPR
jgi:hypothetical protein